MRFVLAAALCAGCVSIDVREPGGTEIGALEAIMRASPRTCPADRTAENAQSGVAGGEAVGVTITEIARTPLADGSGALRTRRIVVAPGGALPWHEHSGRQGMAIVVAGQLLETRNSCRDPMRYFPGDVARETADLAHAWANDSDAPATLLAIDVVRD